LWIYQHPAIQKAKKTKNHLWKLGSWNLVENAEAKSLGVNGEWGVE
jgi:hypothetical protein